ncbi:MAG: NitT/TauT family transport system ATP-binding protein [Actinomycetota bacterium]|nr:NitT/TauT family transport system ATP-binding protein [Actinomycetota bacterium]
MTTRETSPPRPGTSGGVSVRDVSKRYATPKGETLTVLDNVSLDVQPGEFVSIVGPSGCGKTTLLRILQGLEQHDSGDVLVDSQPPGKVATGFVFQKASLFPWRTVERNVSFGLDLTVLKGTPNQPPSKAERKRRVAQLLELTNLTEFADYYPSQISGGMQQRVNLARALAIQPSVLLMDEPFSALDAQTREKLQRDLQKVVAGVGTTTVFITHDIREAIFQADRVFVMAANPGRFIKIYEIDEKHPRGAEFQQSDRIAELSREIWKLLHVPKVEAPAVP